MVDGGALWSLTFLVVAIALVNSVVGAAGRWLVLRRALGRVRRRKAARDEQYAEFVQLGLYLTRLSIAYARLLAAVAPIVVVAIPVPALQPLSPAAVAPGAVLILGALAMLLPPIVVQLATSGTDARAMRELDGLRITGRDVLGMRLWRIGVHTLPLLCLLLAAGVLAQLGPPMLLWIPPALAVLLGVFRVVCAPWLLWRALGAVPMEQTHWAPVAARARKWALSAGVPLGRIGVLPAARCGFAAGSATRGPHPALMLTDAYLAASEWRQQDAAIGVLLGYMRERYPLNASVAVAVDLILPVSLASIALAIWPTATFSPQDERQVAGIVMVVVGTVLLDALLYLVFAQLTVRGATTAAWRFGVQLTGDPAARLVSNHTMAALQPRYALNDSSGALGLIARHEAILMRAEQAGLRALVAELVLPSAPRAPWANAPVPSSFAYTFEGVTWTCPPTDAPAIESPAPSAVAPSGTSS